MASAEPSRASISELQRKRENGPGREWGGEGEKELKARWRRTKRSGHAPFSRPTDGKQRALTGVITIYGLLLSLKSNKPANSKAPHRKLRSSLGASPYKQFYNNIGILIGIERY
jgi:hypothetical protein